MSSFDLEVHVSPAGSADGDGTSARPLDTLEHARDLLRHRRVPGQTAAILLAGGRYPITGPLVFEPQDSYLTVRGASAVDGDKAIVDGGVVLDSWAEVEVNGTTVWASPAPSIGTIHSLFAGGERLDRPRFPRDRSLQIAEQPGLDLTRSASESMFDGTYTFRAQPGDIGARRDLDQIEVIIPHYWIQERMPIVAFDEATGTVRSSRRSMFALRDDVVGAFAKYWLENVYESLGEVPGEWYHDRSAGHVLYVPRPGEVRETFTATAPLAEQLVVVRGADGDPVVDVSFENITFRHTDWIHPRVTRFGSPEILDPEIKYASAPQASIDVIASVEFTYARNCGLIDSILEHVGGYGVALDDGVVGARIVGNLISDLGCGGIAINGALALGLPGVTRDNVVTDNEIVHGGLIFPAGIGVLIRHSPGNTVSHNHIHDLHYSGVSCGWVWGYTDNISRDNHIEHNHIHDIGHGRLSDMGGIYVLGVQPGTVLRGNLIHTIRCANYGGWCAYLDEGSSHVIVEDNVCYDAGTQAFHQHYGRENVIRNNVFANGARGQLAISRIEDHLSLTFERNIVVGAGRPAFVGRDAALPTRLRIISDLNLFWDTVGPTAITGEGRPDAVEPDGPLVPLDNGAWHALGYDTHSVIADPGLTLPVEGEPPVVTLTGEQVAAIGFRPIDLSNVGPRSRAAR